MKKNKSGLYPKFTTLFVILVSLFLLASCVVEAPSSDPDPEGDTTAPTPGGSGLITATVTADSVTLNWTGASDNSSSSSALLYKVYYSTSQTAVSSEGGLSTASGLGEFASDQSSATVTGLAEATMYYFNVAVKDTEDNTALYDVKDARTLDITAPVVSNYTISVTGTPNSTLSLNWTEAADSTDITYGIYQSTSANVDTLEAIDENSISALKTVTGTSTTISDQPLDMDYINIVATDEDGNQATYAMATVDNRNSVEGSVVDGYIRNALVCLDFNLNDECDDGEPYQKTDSNGDYDELMVSESELAAVDVPVIVLQGGVDIATGERFTSLLKAPVINGNTQVNLSPITGILAQKLLTAATEDPTFVLDATELDSAKDEVAATLGLPSTVDVMDDPIEAAQTLGSDGKTLLQKAVQIQKIVEIVAAAEKDATGDADTVNQSKRAKTSNILKALAAQMDSTSKSIDTIIDGMADATADVPKASTIKTTLQAVAAKVETAFSEKAATMTTEDINQVNTVAETISEAIEEQVDNDWVADAATFAGSFDAAAATTELNSYDITGDANLWDKMEVDRLLRMAGVDQTTDVSTAEYDYLLDLFYDDANTTSAISVTGTTTIEEFLSIISAQVNDATFDAALQSTVQSMINSYLIEYASLLRLNTPQSVTLAPSENVYFSFFSPVEASFYFELSSVSDLASVTVALYSDSGLSSEITLAATAEPTSTLKKLLPADYLNGEYWLKITNTGGGSITFDLEATLKQALVTKVYQRLLTDDMSTGDLNEAIWFNDQEWIVKIDSGQLVLGTKIHDMVRSNSPWGETTFRTATIQAITFDATLLENENTDGKAAGFRTSPIYMYDTAVDIPVGVTINMGQETDGSTYLTFSPVKCTDTSYCDDNFTNLGLDETISNLTIAEGDTFSFSIVWNQANQEFTVGYNGNTTAVDMSTAAPYTSETSGTDVRLSAGVDNPSMFQDPVTYTFGIDNISLDTGGGLTSFETFSSDTFDTSKWINAHGQYIDDGAFRVTAIDNWPGGFTTPFIRPESFKADITMLAQEANGTAAIFRPLYLNGSNTVISLMLRSDTTFTQYIIQAPNAMTAEGNIQGGDVLYKQVLGTTSLGETNTIYIAVKDNVFQFQLDDGELNKITPFDLGIIPSSLPKDVSKILQIPSFWIISVTAPNTMEVGGTIDFNDTPTGNYTDFLVDNVEVLTGKIITTTGKDWEFSSETLYDDFSGGSLDEDKWTDFEPLTCSECSTSTQITGGKMVASSSTPVSRANSMPKGIIFDSTHASYASIKGYSADLSISSYDGLGINAGINMYPDWLNTFTDDLAGWDLLYMQVSYRPVTKQVIYSINAAWAFAPIIGGTLKAVDDPSTVVNVAIGFDGTYAYFKADDQTAIVKITDYYPVSSTGMWRAGLSVNSGLNEEIGSITAEIDNVMIGGF